MRTSRENGLSWIHALPVILVVTGCTTTGDPMEATDTFRASVTVGGDRVTAASASQAYVEHFEPAEGQACLESWRIGVQNDNDFGAVFSFPGSPTEGATGVPQPGAYADLGVPDFQVRYRDEEGRYFASHGGTVTATILTETLAVFDLSGGWLCETAELYPPPADYDPADCHEVESVHIEVVPWNDSSRLDATPEESKPGVGEAGEWCQDGYIPDDDMP